MLSIGDECIRPFLHSQIVQAVNSVTDQLRHWSRLRLTQR